MTTHTVESASRPGTFHTVTTAAGRVTHCTCEGWGYRRKCSHADQVSRAAAPAQYKVTVASDSERARTLGPFTKAMAWRIAQGAQTKAAARVITIAQLGGVMGGDRVVYTLERNAGGWQGFKPGDRDAMWAALDAA